MDRPLVVSTPATKLSMALRCASLAPRTNSRASAAPNRRVSRRERCRFLTRQERRWVSSPSSHSGYLFTPQAVKRRRSRARLALVALVPRHQLERDRRLFTARGVKRRARWGRLGRARPISGELGRARASSGELGRSRANRSISGHLGRSPGGRRRPRTRVAGRCRARSSGRLRAAGPGTPRGGRARFPGHGTAPPPIAPLEGEVRCTSLSTHTRWWGKGRDSTYKRQEARGTKGARPGARG